MWIVRIFSSAIFLTYIILSIPLAFDVGGKVCGLAFSLSLASYYFFYSVLRLVTPSRSRFRYSLIKLIGWTQWLVLPSMLIWSLNRFSIDSDEDATWAKRTFSGKRLQDTSLRQWIFGPDGLVETITVGSWDYMLRWSTPVFQLSEGFCSLLLIQAAGQVTRWLVNRSGRSDSWMVHYYLISENTLPSNIMLTIHTDWIARDVRLGYLELRLLPVASNTIS